MTQPRIIAAGMQKGGVAKTTTVINLGAEIAAKGKRVLLIDMDPQGHLSEGFGLIADELPTEISRVLSDHSEATLAEVMLPVGENLFLAPSNILLADLELELVVAVRREDRLKNALRAVSGDFDYILIDCPPSLGILTLNAFSAANEVIAPMACEFSSLLGVAQLLKSVHRMQKVLNPDLHVTAILPTRLDRRTKHGYEVIERAKIEFAPVPVLESYIPEIVAVKNSFAAGQPLITFEPESAPRHAYRQAAREIMSNGS